VNTQVNVDIGAAVKELIAALVTKPVIDPSIPSEIAVHLDGDNTPDEATLARLETIIDGGGRGQ
jgi:hypothetical protein